MKIKLLFVLFMIINLVVVSVLINNNIDTQNQLILAYFPNVGHILPIVGTETNIFSNNMNNLEIQEKLFESGPQVIESLFSKSVDVAYVGPGPSINGFIKSDKHGIKIISNAASGGISFVSHPASNITSISDLSGKRIAAQQIGNTQDISLRTYLYENELKPVDKGGSVYILNISNSDIYTLFSKNEIDAAWVSEPWATILVRDLHGIRLLHEHDLWPEQKFSSVVLISRSDYSHNHKSTIQDLINSNMETINWINTNPNKIEMIFDEFLYDFMGHSLDEEIINVSLSNILISTDPMNSSIYTFAEHAYELGYLGRQKYDLTGIFYLALDTARMMN